ncbi:hypothetical protein K438DRAFT_1751346 [Mycena galopus ATCC 62051]|nr:hypothetical protein K438DRAFT_1751346 [Mycena galopus ATCC 62051]
MYVVHENIACNTVTSGGVWLPQLVTSFYLILESINHSSANSRCWWCSDGPDIASDAGDAASLNWEYVGCCKYTSSAENAPTARKFEKSSWNGLDASCSKNEVWVIIKCKDR